MIVLGVTGGIGSGKTAVCRLLEMQGARVFYADQEARRLMEEDTALRADLAAAFGPSVFDDGGRLDRAGLAAQVFGDAEKLAVLNGLVHPRVFAAFGRETARARAEGVWLFVKEAALIFEAGGEKYLDAVAVVDAPLDVRVARVVARDGATPAAVDARIRHQLPAAELVARADYVLRNDGDAAHLEGEVEDLIAWLRARWPDAAPAGGGALRTPAR